MLKFEVRKPLSTQSSLQGSMRTQKIKTLREMQTVGPGLEHLKGKQKVSGLFV